MPRDELGVITAISVTLNPKFPLPAQMLGNIARVLMSFANDDFLGSIIFKKTSLLGVEKLICAMASCSDIRVKEISCLIYDVLY